ncbi:MAG: hypothetical protein AAF617_00250 [Bacteroidota bacterium]
MKKIILLACSLFACAILYAQNSTKQLDTELLKKYTNYFTIDNNQLKGAGAKVLKDFIRNSQFVVYGEIHGSKQTSILNEALMPLLADAGFDYFAIEVGPNSAEKLTELSTPASKTVAQLKQFNAAYSVTQGEETAIPVPFFDMVSDAKFLQAARANGMQLWGLDQEYYYSAFFLADEMANSVKGQSNYAEIIQKRDMAKAEMYNYFVAEVKEEIEDPFTPILKDKNVNAYFDAFSKNNTKAQAIIKDLKITWDIYVNWRNDSHVDRISYMRSNFMKNYNEALKADKQPKVYTKIGSLHARKIVANGAYDIGELVTSLAKQNKTQATTIGSWRPYEIDADGNLINYFEKYKRGYKRYKIFMPLAKQDQWAVINLKAIRNAIEKGDIAFPTDGSYHKLRQLVYAYDYQLLIPADSQTTPNR